MIAQADRLPRACYMSFLYNLSNDVDHAQPDRLFQIRCMNGYGKRLNRWIRNSCNIEC
jgi:hypothetical protein